MLERPNVVDAVDWPSLTDAYGGAGDLAAALHAIGSDDADLRRQAYAYLANRLVHQGSRYPASAVAARFLVDVVADPAAPDRFAACQLLRMIAIGDESYRLTECPDPAAQRAQVARQARMTLAELEADHAVWVAAAETEQDRRAREARGLYSDLEADRDAAQCDMEAYDAVRAGVPALRTALAAEDPAVRLHGAHLLAWFPEERGTVVPALTRLVERDDDQIVASTAAVAAALAGGSAADQQLVDALNARRVGGKLAEQWAAALALARILQRPDRDVLDQVYDCLLEAGDGVLNWPFLGGDMSGLAALTLTRLDPSIVPDRVDILALRLRESDPDGDRTTLIGALLDAVFPGGTAPAGAAFGHLSGAQQAAVRALADARVWLDGPVIKSLLRHFGLPEDDEALSAWIRA